MGPHHADPNTLPRHHPRVLRSIAVVDNQSPADLALVKMQCAPLPESTCAHDADSLYLLASLASARVGGYTKSVSVAARPSEKRFCASPAAAELPSWDAGFAPAVSLLDVADLVARHIDPLRDAFFFRLVSRGMLSARKAATEGKENETRTSLHALVASPSRLKWAIRNVPLCLFRDDACQVPKPWVCPALFEAGLGRAVDKFVRTWQRSSDVRGLLCRHGAVAMLRRCQLLDVDPRLAKEARTRDGAKRAACAIFHMHFMQAAMGLAANSLDVLWDMVQRGDIACACPQFAREMQRILTDYRRGTLGHWLIHTVMRQSANNPLASSSFLHSWAKGLARITRPMDLRRPEMLTKIDAATRGEWLAEMMGVVRSCESASNGSRLCCSMFFRRLEAEDVFDVEL